WKEHVVGAGVSGREASEYTGEYDPELFEAEVAMVSAPPGMQPPQLNGVKHIILVMSGKGGVGKSSVATQLALSLIARNKTVGVLDIDLCGPSIPRMLGLDGKGVHQSSAGWVPVFADEKKQLCCMSIGFMLENKDDSVVWRGPKKT
ncbi:cytosolic Fe-S cluster assembly factor cfd1, partial [Podila minutissima]